MRADLRGDGVEIVFGAVKRLMKSEESVGYLRAALFRYKGEHPLEWAQEQAKADADPDTYFSEIVSDYANGPANGPLFTSPAAAT